MGYWDKGREWDAEPKRKTDIKIVHNKLLRGWYVVRGPHHFPLTGPFPKRADAVAWLNRRK